MELRDTGITTARELLDVLMAQKVTHIVISPGSRNAPLLIGASARAGLKKYIINDERTAAFTALGIAVASQKPVVLICTSGSALYNYAPAVAEAFYQHVPLIIISADRPHQWIGQDSQTVVQPSAISHIVKKYFDIPSQSSMQKEGNQVFKTELDWYANRIANEAYLSAMTGVKGPVHINIQFETPFNLTDTYKFRNVRIIKNISNNYPIDFNQCKEIAEYLFNKKILLIAGQMPSNNKLNRCVAEFSKFENVAVFAEPISNLHLTPLNLMSDDVIEEYWDKKLSLHPDVIITLGGTLVSAQWKKFLKDCISCEQWSLGDVDHSIDSYMSLSRHYDADPCIFLGGVSSMFKYLLRKGQFIKYKKFKEKWLEISQQARLNQDKKKYVEEWSEKGALTTTLNFIPSSYNLFISNGQIIRNVFNIINKLPHNIWANRGVSGIEGTNATAFGTSLVYKGPTLLLTGDMSFSYNPQILEMIRLGGDLRIIVINNHGGGIFREIATTRELQCREEYFCSDPYLNLKELCSAYKWNYCKADSYETLNHSLQLLLNNPQSLLEIKIEPTLPF